MELRTKNIGIIGLGRMGEALVRGLLNSGISEPDRICGYDTDKPRCEEIFNHYGIKIQRNNPALIRESDIIIIAVKPDVALPVLREIRAKVNYTGKLFISIAAGVRIRSMTNILGGKVRLIKAMPNVCLIVGRGATAICRGGSATNEDEKTALRIFGAGGLAVVVKEERHLDIVTGLSGSGPAFLYIMMEALCEGGVKCGLPRDLADILTRQTVLGAGALSVEDRRHLAHLRDMVTTPGGTAIAGISELEERAFRATVMNAVESASVRAKELGEVVSQTKEGGIK